ncbi:MAG: hypothetical protein NWQ28_00370 [Nodularia sp. (in: cyanobacteria)]|nr:hypothetical protein [Nodularia sp. (in: cyanobacteria)]
MPFNPELCRNESEVESKLIKDCNVYHLLEKSDKNFIPDIVRKSKFFNDPEIDVVPSHITLVSLQSNLVLLDVNVEINSRISVAVVR